MNRRLHLRLAAFVAAMLAMSLLVNPIMAEDVPPASANFEFGPSAINSPAEIQTIAGIAVSSYDELISDVGFLGSLGGRQEVAQMLEGMIALFTQGQGLEGIDKTKPWGVLVQTDGMQVLPVGCLPVTNVEKLFALAQNFQADVRDADAGLKAIDLASGNTIYVKSTGNWAFLAPSPEPLAFAPQDPETQLAALLQDYDIGVRLSLKKVPDMLRQQAMFGVQMGMQQGMQQAMQRQPDEDDEQYQLRKQLTETQLQNLTKTIEAIDEVFLGLAVSAEEQRTYFDMTVTAVPGTELAAQMATYRDTTTDLAGFSQPDSAFSMTTTRQLTASEIEQGQALIAIARNAAFKAIDQEGELPDEVANQEAKAIVSDVVDAVASLFENGVLDFGASLNTSGDSVTFVAAQLVPESDKCEAAFKRLAGILEDNDEFPTITWNADRYQDVNIHTWSLPIPADKEKARQVFGDNFEMALGVGNDAVYFAAGYDHLAALKQAIDVSRAEAGKPVPPAALSISLAPIVDLAVALSDAENTAKLQSIAEMLRTETPSRDHVRMVWTPIPDGIRYRFEAEEGVLKAIGAGAAAAQRGQTGEAISVTPVPQDWAPITD